MSDKYRVHDFVKHNCSEISEYIGEGYMNRFLRNDILVDKLNSYVEMEESLYIEVIKIDEKIKELENDLKNTIKAGMSTGIFDDEIEIYEDFRDALTSIIDIVESADNRIFEKRTREALEKVENNPNREIMTKEEFLKKL